MPAKDQAEYMRNRRKQLKDKLGTQELVQDENGPTPIGSFQKPKGFDCGCRPGNLCIGHGIQLMSQKSRDEILNRINKA